MNECNNKYEYKREKLQCSAKWRLYHPFGNNSKVRVIFERKHDKHCQYNQEN